MSSETDSFTYNSVDFGLSGKALHVVSRKHAELPRPRTEYQSYAHLDGDASWGAHYNRRVWILRCEVKASTTADRETKMAAIVAALLTSREGPKALVFGWRTGFTYQARMTSPIDGDLWLAGETFELIFEAAHPWALAAAETNELETISGDSTFVIAVGGAHPASPTWTIKNGAAATVAGVTLQNVTRGETFAFEGPLIANEWLLLSPLAGTVQRDNASGGASYVNAISGVTGPIPRAKGGASNTIKVFGVASGSLLMDYFAEST